jgi:hypothetical protein
MNLQESLKRIIKEEIKSRFFLRRVDLDLAKDMLPINAQQVYYETESYEQFKYELTLKVVEAIMWNKYNLGWEDLPEQEEIEFVTKISDVFEKTIKHLYHIYYNKEKLNSGPTLTPEGMSSKQEQNEGEITERCWKGYTQKGMKTMFGKRYPNCVKKTK